MKKILLCSFLLMSSMLASQLRPRDSFASVVGSSLFIGVFASNLVSLAIENHVPRYRYTTNATAKSYIEKSYKLFKKNAADIASTKMPKLPRLKREILGKIEDFNRNLPTLINNRILRVDTSSDGKYDVFTTAHNFGFAKKWGELWSKIYEYFKAVREWKEERVRAPKDSFKIPKDSYSKYTENVAKIKNNVTFLHGMLFVEAAWNNAEDLHTRSSKYIADMKDAVIAMDTSINKIPGIQEQICEDETYKKLKDTYLKNEQDLKAAYERSQSSMYRCLSHIKRHSLVASLVAGIAAGLGWYYKNKS